jgi:hypothetical protein
MQHLNFRSLSRVAMGAFAASIVTSCSLPPEQAWRQIQRDGLIPFVMSEWNSTTPAANSNRQQMIAKRQTPAPSIAAVTSAPRTTSDLIGPPIIAANTTPSPAMIDATKIPTAPAAVGIPGYVRSPHTTPGRLVDVRGMAAGSKVVCPFTHKPFIVPAGAVSNAPVIATNATPAPSAPKIETPASSTISPTVPPPSSQVAALNQKAMNTPPATTTPAPSTPAVSQTPPAPATAKVDDLPAGIPITGRPGFVNSPFAAKHQLVDVTGLPVGMEVKCPYTGKLFRVPSQPQAQGQVPVTNTAAPQKK